MNRNKCMIIEEIRLPIKELVEGFHEDDDTSRVVAWGGKLDIRPEYQREYVYSDKKRDAVIDTVMKGYPLNGLYFVDREDGTYEVLDGQQRTISICRYAHNMFSVKIPEVTGNNIAVNRPNLYQEDAEHFDNYTLLVYVCKGSEKDKMGWFRTINMEGEKMEDQELRNAVYHCAWLTDAKSLFSRKNCRANQKYGKYMSGSYIRQKFLETVFAWRADAEGIKGDDAIEQYMQKHRNDENADDLWEYFEDVFKWVQTVFGKYDSTMKGVQWGLLYNRHKDDELDTAEIQRRIPQLLADREVQKKSGIYEYLLTGEEKCLSLRAFDKEDKITMYHSQNGCCAICGKPFEIEDMHADHIKPWSKGGKTTLENGQMLCVTCNLKKSNH